jgi:CO/xanthine dehydrogenase Mo-binding subunit
MPWMAYDIANTRYDFVSLHADSIVQSAAWRSVVANNWAFGQEGFIDELATAAGVDPYRFRVRLLESGDDVDVGHSNKLSRARLRRVLDLAAAKSGWGRGKRGKGRGQGIAVFPYMHGNSYAALVIDVVVTDGRIKVERAVAAVDVGRVINPSGLRQQIEGGIVWGMTAALYGGIDIQNGRVMNGNFNDTPVVRMNECPRIEVHFIENPGDAPHGSGELSPPLVAPALANAIFAATGKRLRQLPLSLA